MQRKGIFLLLFVLVGGLLFAGPNEDLLDAAMYGELSKCREALAKGANLNVRNSESWTALMLASLNGYSEVVEALLEKGAAVDLQSSDGFTALMFASGNGHLSIVKKLIEAKANVHHVSLFGESALTQAIYAGDDDIVALLEAEGASRELYEMNRALLDAAASDKVEQIEQALEGGANINAIDPETGWTALMYAAKDGDKELTAYLLEKGAFMDIADYNDRTALSIATDNGFKELVAILNRYSKTNVRKKSGAPSEPEGQKRWIDSEIGLRMRDKPDLTGKKLDIIPYKDMVILLEESGDEKLIAGRKGKWSKVDWKGRRGWVFGGFLRDTPFKEDEKKENGSNKSEEKSSASSAQLSNSLLTASRSGNTTQMEKLLTDGADLNSADQYGKTALMLAAISGKTEAVKLLLEKGADPNIQAKNGGTALIMAAFNGRRDIVELLIEHEADVNLKDKYGKTALQLAIKKSYHSIATLLKKAGAE